MRVSDFFNLGQQQATLDFVDVDVINDVTIYVDPHALSTLQSQWAHECRGLIQHFFRTVLDLIIAGDHNKARGLLRTLKEPNETHFGLSKGRSRGRALGDILADDIWASLRDSEAVSSGLIQDLEDTILMVDGVGPDIISDVTTNVIREPLIHYTQSACRAYGITMQPAVDSGPIWSPTSSGWHSAYIELPTVNGERLLLIPKAIVRQRLNYDSEQYYRHYIIEQLMQVELAANSALVKIARDGTRRVTIKSLKEKYGTGKGVIERETLRNPDLLRKYREDRTTRVTPALSHGAISESNGSPLPAWDDLLNAVTSVPTGAAHATEYEKAVEKLLTALFYPSLSMPTSQFPIHNGRKRIDITFTNASSFGFFYWLALNYPAPLVFVECKNYASEIANPELDQMAGRFSPSRGQFGLVICRTFDNKALFIQRCIDTAKDNRGYIVVLDDQDLAELVQVAKSPGVDVDFTLIHDRFLDLIAS